MNDPDPSEPPWVAWLAVVLTLIVCAFYGAPFVAELIGAYW